MCANALVALVLLTGLIDVDEIMVVLVFRFVLDVATVAQQCFLLANHDSFLVLALMVSMSSFSVSQKFQCILFDEGRRLQFAQRVVRLGVIAERAGRVRQIGH